MKYFDVIPTAVENELIKRGVSIDQLLYCVKADLDGEGCYIDVYMTFTADTLHIISGYEIYSGISRKTKKSELTKYEVSNYTYMPISDISNASVDRHQHTARFMVQRGEKEFSIARFSLGFSDKFEKFAQRINQAHNNEEFDDTLLDELKTHCTICVEPFPDPNRPICPYCMDKRSILKRLIKMFGQFKGSMISILLCIFMSGAFAIISPYFGTKLLYDDVLAKDGAFYGKIGMIVLIMAVFSFLSMVLRSVSSIIMCVVTPKVIHKLRVSIFSTMQTLSLPYFTSKQTGSLMTRVNNDSDNVFWFFTDIVPYGLINVAKIIGIITVMFYLSPILALGILLVFLIVQIVGNRFFMQQRKLYRKQNVAVRGGNNVLSDAMNGQRVVKAFAKEGQEVERYSNKNQELFIVESMINTRLANTMPILEFLLRIVSTLLYCAGALMVIKGHLEFGALTAIIIYTDMVYEPVRFFSWIGDRMAKCIDAASRMFEILDAKPTVKESENPVHINNMAGDIELKNVSFEYEAGRPIINDVSFKIEAGQMFGIVGKTGAGKSTIINLMARLFDVTGGEILIDGVKLKEIANEDLRRNIGIVSQETYLFIGTIADNIRYARPDASMEEVIEAAKSANAHEFISKQTDGYNTQVGAGGITLSGGEKQRISIARAIIQKPNILILDEATASMDTRTERKIQVAIDALKQGRTIISIAHRLSTLRDADMLCVIENGELKEIGTHDELIHQKGKYFELYKLQSDALKFIEMG